MRCLPPSGRLSQSGAALIIAMLVFALVSALLVGLQRDFTLTLQRGAYQVFSEHTWSYLLGAESLATLALREDARLDARASSSSDHLEEIWAQPTSAYPLDAGGWLDAQISDLQGRFNINLLVATDAIVDVSESSANNSDPPISDQSLKQEKDDQRWNSAQKMFIRLLQSLENSALTLDEAISLTEAVSDFIDQDSLRRLEGAEDQEYRYLTSPYLPANRPLASVSELRAVRGMSAALYEALSPLVSVWPVSGGRLNILTAPISVIRSINDSSSLEPLDLNQAESLMQARDEGAFSNVEEFLSNPNLDGLSLEALSPLLTSHSDWFLLEARVELLDRERHLYSVLHRSGETSVAVFRSEGEL